MAAVSAAAAELSGSMLSQGTSEAERDPDSLALGELDITTEALSLAGVEKEIEAFADSEMLKAILDQGGDPKAFGRQYEAQLRAAELESIQDYIAESDNLLALHSQIKECDDILAAMEGSLGRFQADLGNISSEIRTLQEQSSSMSSKLKNRKLVQERLEHFIEHIAIPPSLITSIMQAEIGDDFLASLQQLAAKLDFVEKDEQAKYTAAYRDVAPELERLKVRAIGRCRDFLMDRIYDLRKPKTNVQIKQNVLLKYKYMISFLKAFSRDIFAEVRAAYVERVSGKILDLFRGYWALMDRLEEHLVTQADVIGAPEAPAATGVMSFFQRGPAAGSSSSSSSSARSDVYALRDRAGLLAQLEAPPLILHVAESEGKKFPYEVLFRSLQKLLMDTAAHEYLFCCDFWGEDAVYSDLFAPVLAFVETSLAAVLQEMYDPIAVLLMIRVNRESTLAMNRRRLPALDAHFDRVNLLLWPRLKALFDLQLNSIKQLHPTADPTPRLQLLTERYAHLTASILLLHADFVDGPLEPNIERLRYSVMNLLLNMSRQYSTKGRGTVFLILNFSFVVAVLKDAHAKGLPAATAPSASSTDTPGLGSAGLTVVKEFEDSLARCTSIYVEEELTKTVPSLVNFVKRAESAVAQLGCAEGQAIPGYGPAEAQPVARDFSGRWQAAVETINRDVSKDFGATPAGRAVLQAAFTQLMLYYNRFLELLKRQGPGGLTVARDAVPMPTIMYGLRHFS